MDTLARSGLAHQELLLADPANGDENFELTVEVNSATGYLGLKFPPSKLGDLKASEVLFSEASLVSVNKLVRAFRRAGSLFYELASSLIERSPLVRTMNELTEQFYCDVAPGIPESPFRAEQIFQKFGAALDRFDLQAGPEQLADQAAAAMALLEPILEESDSPRRFTVNAVPNSHLDVVWMWALDETVRKSARTLASTLRLIERYPHYRFLFSQSIPIQMVKDNFPGFYEQVRAAVRNGRLDFSGGMWVEPDSSLPGGQPLRLGGVRAGQPHAMAARRFRVFGSASSNYGAGRRSLLHEREN